jgi:Cu/Ag efflux pump CusA
LKLPPGPPVLATLLAEIYGPDEESRRRTAVEVEKLFKAVPYIVDTDNSVRRAAPDSAAGARSGRIDQYGLSERQLFDSIGALLGNQTVGYVPRGDGP